MTPWQVFRKVELPLVLPLLIGGLRAAVLQVIAIVTIAAYVNLGGLGWPIIQGIPLRRFDHVLAGVILVAVSRSSLTAPAPRPAGRGPRRHPRRRRPAVLALAP